MAGIKDIEILVENYFNTVNSNLSFSSLLEMVGEVMREPLLEGKGKAGKKMTITLPIIRLSEKMWGKAGSNDREVLTKLLGEVISSGDSLSGKLVSINDFLKREPDPEATTSEVLSHIIFLDTLTNIMVHFNPSAAGFTFESFLSVLLQGEQVPAGTAGIQDLVDNDKNPISLKLLTEYPAVVEGSYKDLVSHFLPERVREPGEEGYVAKAGAKGEMKYIICLKDFKEKHVTEEGMHMKGSIHFYEFDFTAKTFLEALKSKKHNSKLLHLSKDALEGREEPGAEEEYIPDWLIDEVKSKLTFISPGEKVSARKYVSKIIEEFTPAAVKEFLDQYEPVPIAYKKKNPTQVLKYGLRKRGTEDDPSEFNSAAKELLRKAGKPGFDVLRKARAGQKMQSEEFYPLGYSVRILEDALKQEGPEKFWSLIRQTSGYLGPEAAEATQFHIDFNYYKNWKIGEIELGRSAIDSIAEKYADKLQQRIFDIFAQLEQLTDQLNSYFVAGEKPAGLKAADTADEIETGTRKHAEEEKLEETILQNGAPDVQLSEEPQ